MILSLVAACCVEDDTSDFQKVQLLVIAKRYVGADIRSVGDASVADWGFLKPSIFGKCPSVRRCARDTAECSKRFLPIGRSRSQPVDADNDRILRPAVSVALGGHVPRRGWEVHI